MSMMRRTTLQKILLFVFGLLPLVAIGKTFQVKEIGLLTIDSAITPATFDYLDYQFKNIPSDSLILIKINTPGGLISTTKDIISLIGSQTKPIVVWVTPEGASAASAGALIASSAHFILMNEGTSLGAATPVGLGKDLSEKDGRAKTLNDLKAMVRSLCELRGRPSAPFEEMIETAKSFTSLEAKKLSIIDGIMIHEGKITDLLRSKHFSLQGEDFTLDFEASPVIKEYAPTLGQKILSVLADPSVAYFLFLLGLALIYFELQAPGGYIAGGIGLKLIILAAIAFQVLPLNWGALVLIVIGVILLILEIHITSYGLLAIGGLAAFIAGSLFLFHGEGGFISIDYPVLISTLLGIGFALAIIVWYVLREKKKQPHHENFFLPLGSTGVVLNCPMDSLSFYQIKVRGEIWRATSQEHLKLHDDVIVTLIDKEKLIATIKKVTKE